MLCKAKRTCSSPRGQGGAFGLLLSAAILVVSSGLIVSYPQKALAAGGDFSLDFISSAPLSYDHTVGGGAYDVRTIGVDKDVVESLEGSDFACGDTVTYLIAVTVDDTEQAATDAPQTIQMDFSFLADTTGQSGVALGDIQLVEVNYAPIVDWTWPSAAGDVTEDADDGIIDDGGSTATLVDEYFLDKKGIRDDEPGYAGGVFIAGTTLNGSIKLTDLERAEQVIVRIDVELQCQPGSNPTGNLAADLKDALLIFKNLDTPVEPPEAISGGQQTIPFKQIGEIESSSLTLVKHVVNDNGGTAVASDWTLSAGTNSVTGSESGALATIVPGTYDLSESSLDGYTNTSITCDNSTGEVTSVTVDYGEDVTCTFVNNDIQPKLTLVKTVNNQYGGTATKADFQAKIDGNNVPWDSAQGLNAGSYTASESFTIAGYTAGDWGGDCAANGSVTLSVGDDKTCTITNSDVQPKLTLVKTVNNQYGGTATKADFQAKIDGNNVPWDSAQGLNAGSYTASESFTIAGYTAGDWGGDCAANGLVTLSVGDDKTCTITNSDVPGYVSLIKTLDGNELVGGEGPFNFTLTGPGAVNATGTAPPSPVDFGNPALYSIELGEYQYRLCETGINAAWTTEWYAVDGTTETPIPFVPGVSSDPINPTTGYSRVFDPNYSPSTGNSNDVRCIDFVAYSGVTRVFKINNVTPPGGDQRTIGYWKNWNSCTGGGQLRNALEAGATPSERITAGKALLNDALQSPGIDVGLLTLATGPDVVDQYGDPICDADTQIAVYLLDKRDAFNSRHKKMAGDSAYGLAAQYIAAKANYAVNAGQCPAATTAINDAQTLLAGIEFDGTGTYFKVKGNKIADINGYTSSMANALAGILDDYNNGIVCPSSP
jgi:hypothetical protein